MAGSGTTLTVVAWELLVSAATATAAAVAFLAVARVVAAREMREQAAASANRLFALWWTAIAGWSLLFGGISNTLAAFGIVHVATFATLRNVALIVLLAGLFGLTYYFVFLLVGTTRAMLPVGLLYLGIYALLVYTFAERHAVGVAIGTWQTTLVFDTPPDPLLFGLARALLGLPQVIGAVAYLWLAFRLQDRPHRYRGALVGSAISLWAASYTVAELTGDSLLRFITGPLLGLLAAGVAYAAYQPPPWARRRVSGDAPAPR